MNDGLPLEGLSPGSLFASMVIGAIGTALFIYGKKQSRLPQALIGIVLGVFPYFVDGVVWMSVIAAAMLGALWFLVRLGY